MKLECQMLNLERLEVMAVGWIMMEDKTSEYGKHGLQSKSYKDAYLPRLGIIREFNTAIRVILNQMERHA